MKIIIQLMMLFFCSNTFSINANEKLILQNRNGAIFCVFDKSDIKYYSIVEPHSSPYVDKRFLYIRIHFNKDIKNMVTKEDLIGGYLIGLEGDNKVFEVRIRNIDESLIKFYPSIYASDKGLCLANNSTIDIYCLSNNILKDEGSVLMDEDIKNGIEERNAIINYFENIKIMCSESLQ